MIKEIELFNSQLQDDRQAIGTRLAEIITDNLAFTENKIWHAHPVWFIDNNPIVGYSSLKDGIRLMFWSGADFDEDQLKPGTGKYKDASITYADVSEVDEAFIKRCLKKSEQIQWNYRDIYKAKGVLNRLK